MDLFKTFAGVLGENADVTIVVRRSTDGRLIVSTNFRNNDVKDAARDVIAPFVVSGTPEELDEGYLGAIAAPLEQSSGLQTSMANFEASKKAAEAKSQAASEAKRKDDAAKKAAKDKFTRVFDEAKKLMDARKWKEARTKLAEASTLADDAQKASVAAALSKCEKNDVPDIFNFGADPEEPSVGTVDDACDESPDCDIENDPEDGCDVK